MSWVWCPSVFLGRKFVGISWCGREGRCLCWASWGLALGEIIAQVWMGSKLWRGAVPTGVFEHHSSHALALAVKKLLSIISCLSSFVLLHYPFLKTVCNHFRMINKVTLQGRKLCITLFLSLGKSLLWLKCFNSSLSCIASTWSSW